MSDIILKTEDRETLRKRKHEVSSYGIDRICQKVPVGYAMDDKAKIVYVDDFKAILRYLGMAYSTLTKEFEYGGWTWRKWEAKK